MENAKFEIKLNSRYYEEIIYDEATEDNRLILQQFESDSDKVYICLNGLQLQMKIDDLHKAVEFLHINSKVVAKNETINV